MRLAMVAALLGVAAPLAAHGAAPQPAAEASATVDSFHDALRRGDTRTAAALLADDALIFESGGAERTKAEYSTHHLPADAAFSSAVSSMVTRRSSRSAGDLAWVASEGRTTGRFKDKPVDLLTTETMVLRRDAGSWKIVHIHWSSAKKR